MQHLRDKAQEWIDLAKNGHLHRRQLWFSVDRQFWPKVGYGICSLVQPWKELSHCLKQHTWQLVPLGGVARTAKEEMRQLERVFFGAGCPHLGMEVLIQQSNKLLMHYGCQSSLGLKMQLSMELLIIKLGMSSQPFQVSHKMHGHLVTHSWLRSLWEKTWMFGIRVEVNNVPIKFSREGDRWLMAEFVEMGFNASYLKRLNRVRLFQKVVFVSDVLAASGTSLDKKYLCPRPDKAKWSKYPFPREQPPTGDF